MVQPNAFNVLAVINRTLITLNVLLVPRDSFLSWVVCVNHALSIKFRIPEPVNVFHVDRVRKLITSRTFV